MVRSMNEKKNFLSRNWVLSNKRKLYLLAREFHFDKAERKQMIIRDPVKLRSKKMSSKVCKLQILSSFQTSSYFTK
jgi:hypothetical protein